MKPEFDQDHSIIGKLPLKLVYFAVGTVPFLLFRDFLNPLNQHTPVPAPVENADASPRRQSQPETSQVVVCFFAGGRSRDRVDLITAGVQSLDQPFDISTLTRCVRAFV